MEPTDTVLAICGRTNSIPGEEGAYGAGTYCKPGKGRTVFGLEQQHNATVHQAGLCSTGLAAVTKPKNEVTSSKNMNTPGSHREVSQTEVRVGEIRHGGKLQRNKLFSKTLAPLLMSIWENK